jgi:hypothetical protein
MIGSQMVERPWGVVAYGAANVKAMPDLVRVRFKVVRVASCRHNDCNADVCVLCGSACLVRQGDRWGDEQWPIS